MKIKKLTQKKLPKKLPKHLYPLALERQLNTILQRQITEIERSYRKILKPYLQLAGKVYKKGVLDSTVTSVNFWNQHSLWLSSVNDIVKNPEYIKQARQVYEKLIKNSENQMNNQVKKITGIKVYGKEPWINSFLNQQIKQHADLIVNVGEQIKTDIRSIVRRNASLGLSRETMIAEIEEGLQGKKGRFKVLRTRAELIARTETANFYAAVNKTRFIDSGLDTFTWQSVGDSRVRPSHRAVDGKVYRWDDPSLPDGGPGNTFNCRCVADINLEEFNE